MAKEIKFDTDARSGLAAGVSKLADAVKAGIRMAGGTPVLVPAIGVCDGIAMGHIGMKYSLASRELICDSVETCRKAVHP